MDRKGSLINIRIGDSKKYVRGNQTYVITYQSGKCHPFFDDHDELYWNVTGNDWKAPIREASADVTLAVKNKSKDLWAAGYKGVMVQRKKVIMRPMITAASFSQRET